MNYNKDSLRQIPHPKSLKQLEVVHLIDITDNDS